MFNLWDHFKRDPKIIIQPTAPKITIKDTEDSETFPFNPLRLTI